MLKHTLRSGLLPAARALPALLALLALPPATKAAPATKTAPGAPSGEAALQLSPSRIQIGLFYDGQTVHVRGTAPAGLNLAVLCAGPARTVHLKKKGKVWGVLWMNVGDITFDKVPSLYVLSTSAPLSRLAPEPELARLGVGIPGLRARSLPTATAEQGRLFAEMVKLERARGRFSVSEGGVRLQPAGDGKARFSATCRFPAHAPEGAYQVTVLGFRDGKGKALARRTVTVAEVGAAAFIRNLAREHGLLYGVLAVVIALGVGLLTGFLFGLGGKGAH